MSKLKNKKIREETMMGKPTPEEIKMAMIKIEQKLNCKDQYKDWKSTVESRK